ncbi:superoxide dismutase 1 copper chaperone [Gossypium arboreum]|uniref:Superoxide dismutase 1 copper chaperone n=3 Tax=Gossypium arboreum TaxID=29729 RepID=A0A0B0PAC4_GOSAR|nr:hypothetical protein PVK06_022627 [Gossypium arboreum]KHG21274.1 superoxide dismutase 1 copper chaperone [Gossypium arboreum]
MEEKKVEDDGKKSEEKKETKEETTPPPPPPPQEIVLKVYMHCEGCARKVRRCLKGFQGVEDVMTDCKSNKVVVKGEKADPLKVLERVQRKSHKQVELLSPIPKPPPTAEDKKPEENEKPKSDEKKEEPQVIMVVLKVHMHCEACAQGIKKRIQRMKGVESAEPDLKSSEVIVKGVFSPPKLIEYVYKRTGKHAVIVKQEPPPPPDKKEEEKPKDGGKEEKKNEESSGEKDKKDSSSGGGDDKGKDNKGSGGGEGGEANVAAGGGGEAAEGGVEETRVAVELKKNEFDYYPLRYATEFYAYPPQYFSDENPNACSIM